MDRYPATYDQTCEFAGRMLMAKCAGQIDDGTFSAAMQEFYEVNPGISEELEKTAFLGMHPIRGAQNMWNRFQMGRMARKAGEMDKMLTGQTFTFRPQYGASKQMSIGDAEKWRENMISKYQGLLNNKKAPDYAKNKAKYESALRYYQGTDAQIEAAKQQFMANNKMSYDYVTGQRNQFNSRGDIYAQRLARNQNMPLQRMQEQQRMTESLDRQRQAMNDRAIAEQDATTKRLQQEATDFRNGTQPQQQGGAITQWVKNNPWVAIPGAAAGFYTLNNFIANRQPQYPQMPMYPRVMMY